MAPVPIMQFQRRRLREELDKRIACARDQGVRLALLVINLQEFRQINISFGHQVGDQVLQQVAARIATALRIDDMVLHIGNDEFAVILSDLKGVQVAQLAAEKILAGIAENRAVAGQMLAVCGRLGAAVFPDHASSRDELMRAADSAVQFAADHHRDYAIYDASTRLQERDSADLRGSLREAMDNDDFMVYYQPQMNLQQGVLSGCEALSRWKHARRGWINPEVFIAAAERSGLIDELTYWSINVALRKWFEFESAGPDTSISINLSARLLHSPELVGMVERATNIWGATRESVVLEVTESAMMSDPKVALRTLSALHEMGIRLSIDDFGTGYSSLAYLKKLPVSELKIDKSFVIQMAENRQDRKIVQSVIDLAHTLDMSVVAEGIENRQVMDMLVGMGCDYGQGYFIARPMSDAALSEWLETVELALPEHNLC
ncbi:MAG: bifunctional diguanylate cyclase/phosphodiesterase [Thiogranum sp.]|nr:bifunctional diguanylate cyclase/phosphodiesterase [Thiogranum sp.]